MSMPPPGGAPYGGVPVEHPQANTILVLGILSILCLGIILGPIAIIMGNNALREIDQNPMAYSNRSTVNAGRICGIVGTIVGAAGILLAIIVNAG